MNQKQGCYNPWKDRSYFDQFRNRIVIPDEKRKPPDKLSSTNNNFNFIPN